MSVGRWLGIGGWFGEVYTVYMAAVTYAPLSTPMTLKFAAALTGHCQRRMCGWRERREPASRRRC